MTDNLVDLDGRTPLHMHESEPARVRFGPGQTQTMPLEWAEHMLAAWREKSAKQFGEALAKAALEAR